MEKKNKKKLHLIVVDILRNIVEFILMYIISKGSKICALI